MPTLLVNERDRTSAELFGIERSDTIFDVVLPNDTDVSIAVPADARFVLMSASGNFFWDIAAITLPSGGTFTSTTAEYLLGGGLRRVIDTETLHFRTRDTDLDMTISFYE